jgi:hypothetical protein
LRGGDAEIRSPWINSKSSHDAIRITRPRRAPESGLAAVVLEEHPGERCSWETITRSSR